MKFLIITRMKDVFTLLPVEQQARIMDGVIPFIEKYQKAGACKEIYSVPSIKGSVSIWEIESGEKSGMLHLENPASPFQDFEMYPLADFNLLAKKA